MIEPAATKMAWLLKKKKAKKPNLDKYFVIEDNFMQEQRARLGNSPEARLTQEMIKARAVMTMYEGIHERYRYSLQNPPVDLEAKEMLHDPRMIAIYEKATRDWAKAKKALDAHLARVDGQGRKPVRRKPVVKSRAVVSPRKPVAATKKKKPAVGAKKKK